MSIDLTAAVEAVSAAYFDQFRTARRDDGRKRPNGGLWQWGDLAKVDQYAYRVLVLPMVNAAMPSIAAQAWDEGFEYGAEAACDGNDEVNPYRTDNPPTEKDTK